MKRGRVAQARFFYITGADGTGKSTQTQLLIEHLQSRGIQCRHLWLRFPFFFSLPLLAYARWRGYSWHEVTDGVDHGYWDFRCSWLMRRVFPWMFLIDAALASMFKVYLPLSLGHTIVCERFVFDMIVDLMVAFDDYSVHQGLPGKLYLSLMPRETVVIVLDLDADTIRKRRADLQIDRRLEARLNAFRRLSVDQSLLVLSSEIPIIELGRYIRETVGA